MEPDRGGGVRGVHYAVREELQHDSEIRKSSFSHHGDLPKASRSGCRFLCSIIVVTGLSVVIALPPCHGPTGEDEDGAGGDRVLLRLEEDEPLQGVEEELRPGQSRVRLRVCRVKALGGQLSVLAKISTNCVRSGGIELSVAYRNGVYDNVN